MATKDYKAFKPGVPANTPLDDRLNETSQAIKHIRKMKDCPAGVAFAPRLGALTDTEEANMVDPLSPTLCPGYTEEASGYGRKGVRATVKLEHPIETAQRIIKEANAAPCAFPGEHHHRLDKVLVVQSTSVQSSEGKCAQWIMETRNEIWRRTTFLLQSDEGRSGYQTLPSNGFSYTREALVIRAPFAEGHSYYNLSKPNLLDRIAIVNFQVPSTEEELETNFRLLLRLSGTMTHRRIIFAPSLFMERGLTIRNIFSTLKRVMAEREFKGGWWESFVFCVEEIGYEASMYMNNLFI